MSTSTEDDGLWRQRQLIVFIVLAFFFFLGFLALEGGCKNEKPACSPEKLADIEARYVTEALQQCKGQSYDDCKALPDLRAKYQKEREQWIQCK